MAVAGARATWVTSASCARAAAALFVEDDIYNPVVVTILSHAFLDSLPGATKRLVAGDDGAKFRNGALTVAVVEKSIFLMLFANQRMKCFSCLN